MQYINVILAAALVSNFPLVNLLGINPTVASSGNSDSAFSMGMLVTLITVVTSVVTKFVYDAFLANLDSKALQILLFVVIAALILEIFGIIVKNINGESQGLLSKFLPMVSVNSIIIGAGMIAVENGLTLLETLFHSFGAGIGFTLVIVLLSATNHKYRFSNMPRHFREKATVFLALGLMALAFYGFKGLI